MGKKFSATTHASRAQSDFSSSLFTPESKQMTLLDLNWETSGWIVSTASKPRSGQWPCLRWLLQASFVSTIVAVIKSPLQLVTPEYFIASATMKFEVRQVSHGLTARDNTPLDQFSPRYRSACHPHSERAPFRLGLGAHVPPSRRSNDSVIPFTVHIRVPEYYSRQRPSQ